MSARLVSQPISWVILELKQDRSPFGFDLLRFALSFSRRGLHDRGAGLPARVVKQGRSPAVSSRGRVLSRRR